MSKFKPATESPAPTMVPPSAEALPARVVRERRPMQPSAPAAISPNLASETAQTDALLKLQATSAEEATNSQIGNDVIPESQPESGALSVALTLTLLFVFFRFSFLHEIITMKLGVDLHILLVVGGLSVLAALLAGSFFSGLAHRISLAWCGFAVCMVLATIFSIWRGGSFAVLFPYLRTTFILVILIPAVTTSTRSLVKVLNVIGIAGLATIVLGFTTSDFRTGRLELSAGDSIANSNDYAAIVMLMMPAIGFLTLRKKSLFVLKILGCGALGLGCFLVLSTGSRGALISMVLSVLYILKVGSGKVRAAILVGLPVVALVAIPLLPGEASGRLATLFSKQDKVEDEAMASQEQRTELLIQSLKITMKHPVLGVGPGTFQEYEAQEATASGTRGMWHETHNSYTQISSECGLPAFGLYLAAILMTLGVFARGRKSKDPQIQEAASILSLMVVSFMVCMFFLAQGYGFAFPVMGGLAVAMDRLLKRENEFSPV